MADSVCHYAYNKSNLKYPTIEVNGEKMEYRKNRNSSDIFNEFKHRCIHLEFGGNAEMTF